MDTGAEAATGVIADDGLLDALVRLSFTVIGIVSVVGARHDLSLTLVRVGSILRGRSLTMSDLAADLGLDRSSITGLVTRAEERGLVARIGNEIDKRSSLVTLTGAGNDLAMTCAAEIAREIEPVVAPLSAVGRRRLEKLLRATTRVDRGVDRVENRRQRSDRRSAGRSVRR